MTGCVEVRIVLPDRIGEAERRDVLEPLPVARDQVDALANPLNDGIAVHGAVRHQDAAHVHVHRPALRLDRRADQYSGPGDGQRHSR